MEEQEEEVTATMKPEQETDPVDQEDAEDTILTDDSTQPEEAADDIPAPEQVEAPPADQEAADVHQPPVPQEIQGPSSSTTTTTPTLLSIVRAFFEGDDIRYQLQSKEESEIFTTYLTGKAGTYKTTVEVRESQNRVLVYTECPVRCPAHRHSLAAEYLMRANFSLALGNFEVDFRDGEVRYRQGVDVEGSVLSVAMVRQLIMIPASTMDRFFPGLMDVIYGARPPIEAYTEMRSPPAVNPAGQLQ
jgi:hypothetical protein